MRRAGAAVCESLAMSRIVMVHGAGNDLWGPASIKSRWFPAPAEIIAQARKFRPPASVSCVAPLLAPEMSDTRSVITIPVASPGNRDSVRRRCEMMSGCAENWSYGSVS